MKRLPVAAALAVVALLIGPLLAQAADVPKWDIPVQVKRLSNGLTVVVSEDHSSPTFGISVVYKVGFRLEPRGRTGFAHLFEHMMFQGTPNAPKGSYDRVIEEGGGINNGSTRFDYTDYIASAPVSALDAVLWLEADRMKDLDFSPENLANQQQVVKEEIRVNVKNRPYGGLVWTSIGSLAFDKWSNAHDGYGSFEDLDAAQIADVKDFHRTFYAPNNAVVGLAGDLKAEEAFALAEKYFGSIPSQPAPPASDIAENLNTAERTRSETDAFAKVPGLIIGWKVPDPKGPDALPLAVLGEFLTSGDASRLYQRMVKGNEMLLQVAGGLGWPLTDFLRCGGPVVLSVFGLYKPTSDGKAVVDAIQKECDQIAKDGVTEAELERTKTKMLADHFASLETMINRADVLAIRQLLTGSAASINELPKALSAVTAQDLKRVAGLYLTPANRSYVDRIPAASTEKSGK